MAYIFSKGCGYGIQAVLYIAKQNGKRVGGKEIAAALHIPTHFLAKILQSLSENEILESHKGAQGGFALAKPPDAVFLVDIVKSIDGLAVLHECVLGFPDCGTENPCFMHHRWGGVRSEIEQMLSEDSIADLMTLSDNNIRISGIPMELRL